MDLEGVNKDVQVWDHKSKFGGVKICIAVAII